MRRRGKNAGFVRGKIEKVKRHPKNGAPFSRDVREGVKKKSPWQKAQGTTATGGKLRAQEGGAALSESKQGTHALTNWNHAFDQDELEKKSSTQSKA